MLNPQGDLNYESAPVSEEEAVAGLLSILLEQWDDEMPLECDDALENETSPAHTNQHQSPLEQWVEPVSEPVSADQILPQLSQAAQPLCELAAVAAPVEEIITGHIAEPVTEPIPELVAEPITEHLSEPDVQSFDIHGWLDSVDVTGQAAETPQLIENKPQPIILAFDENDEDGWAVSYAVNEQAGVQSPHADNVSGEQAENVLADLSSESSQLNAWLQSRYILTGRLVPRRIIGLEPSVDYSLVQRDAELPETAIEPASSQEYLDVDEPCILNEVLETEEVAAYGEITFIDVAAAAEEVFAPEDYGTAQELTAPSEITLLDAPVEAMELLETAESVTATESSEFVISQEYVMARQPATAESAAQEFATLQQLADDEEFAAMQELAAMEEFVALQELTAMEELAAAEEYSAMQEFAHEELAASTTEELPETEALEAPEISAEQELVVAAELAAVQATAEELAAIQWLEFAQTLKVPQSAQEDFTDLDWHEPFDEFEAPEEILNAERSLEDAPAVEESEVDLDCMLASLFATSTGPEPIEAYSSPEVAAIEVAEAEEPDFSIMMDSMLACTAVEQVEAHDEVPFVAPEIEQTVTGSLSLDALIALMEQELAESLESSQPASTNTAKQIKNKPTSRFVVFQIGGTSFAVPMQSVLETDRLPQTTFVPGLPPAICGVANMRGEILPLVDLSHLLGLGITDLTSDMRVLVVKAGTDGQIGLVVERLGGLATLAVDEFLEVPSMLEDKARAMLTGMGEHRGQLLSVLNLERVLAATEILELAA